MFDEKIYLRDLAKETYDYATSDIMNERRKAWSKQNDLQFTKPLIYIRSIPFGEIIDLNNLKCNTPALRNYEKNLLLNRYRMTLADDYVIEPYITMNASVAVSEHSIWGIECALTKREKNGDCSAFKPSIIETEDWKNMVVTDYAVDEKQTADNYEFLYNVFGNSIPIEINRQTPFANKWNNDIATLLAKMRGLEQLMWDMYDEPEWLHEILTFMRDNILRQMDLCEKAGGFTSINNENQSMQYATGIITPEKNSKINSLKDIWGFLAAQEFAVVGPDFFKEFMFDYQKPILEKYGLVSYGCCEDMTQKIEIIKSLSNLRRIAVTPFSDAKKCAEQIGKDYVASWRPNPSSAIAQGINEDFIRKDMRKHFDIFTANNCVFDITLKDVETQSGNPNAIKIWTDIVRDEIEKYF
ncbi:MAG: hypothetical protein R3Y35_00970 [Clostridia bacterium]